MATENTERQSEWLLEVQQENAELRGMLDQMQSALDLVMIKHRSQVRVYVGAVTKKVSSLLASEKRLPLESDEAYVREKKRADFFEQEVVNLTGKIQEMAGVSCSL